jgi:acetyl-CoA carboxylase biotin carboxyl carrier protein
MEFEDIERILELIRQHDLAEFELERDGLKLRVRKSSTGHPLVPQAIVAASAPVPQSTAQGPMSHPPPSAPLAPEPEIDAVELAVVKSPIVGTFYLSPEPGGPAFVEVGDHVQKDQVLCIIEAMKLMNEITSEYDGEIASIYVENGTPVQYGERLFAIRTSS